jgi:FSR family fosmidomycin resistance protein-like MFS transporter
MQQMTNASRNQQPIAYIILWSICGAHLINDLMQALIPAIYPMIKDQYRFSYIQIGLITMTFQLTASILQPLVGWQVDRKSHAFVLPLASIMTFFGVIGLAHASTFWQFLFAVAFIGMGSSLFHPEAIRVAQSGAGGRKGLAQSIFQIGGNTGSALGPLLAGIIVVYYGQMAIQWFAILPFAGFIVLWQVSRWYQKHIIQKNLWMHKNGTIETKNPFPRKKTIKLLSLLLLLIFSKYLYSASITNFFTFYLIEKFGLSIQQSQYVLFAFLLASAIGTFIGGPLGDRYGRKYIIWFSIAGTAPFALLMPWLSLTGTILCAILAGSIIASAFSSIIVYATELLPKRVGMMAGLFYGFSFGVAGMGAALFGWVAESMDIEMVILISSFLPIIGILGMFLPDLHKSTKQN